MRRALVTGLPFTEILIPLNTLYVERLPLAGRRAARKASKSVSTQPEAP